MCSFYLSPVDCSKKGEYVWNITMKGQLPNWLIWWSLAEMHAFRIPKIMVRQGFRPILRICEVFQLCINGGNKWAAGYKSYWAACGTTLWSQQRQDFFFVSDWDHSYRYIESFEQAKTCPFQIILTENGKNIGVVFCLAQDRGNYYKHLNDGDYAVDSLRLVLLQDLDEFAYEVCVSSINGFNKKCGIPNWTMDNPRVLGTVLW